jgi:vancomycin permeability regulator SanA
MMMRQKRSIRVLLSAVILSPILFGLASAALVIDGLNDDVHKADVAVVLGNAVQPNGEPSPRLKARLDKAVQLYRQGLFPNIIVSGGVGIEGFDEAVVMKRYLMMQGIPDDHVFVDSDGRTTYLTAKHSAHLMKEKGWTSALVISQYFHIPRTRLALKQFGVLSIYSAHAEFFEVRDIYSTAREVVGYGSYLFRDSTAK